MLLFLIAHSPDEIILSQDYQAVIGITLNALALLPRKSGFQSGHLW